MAVDNRLEDAVTYWLRLYPTALPQGVVDVLAGCYMEVGMPCTTAAFAAENNVLSFLRGHPIGLKNLTLELLPLGKNTYFTSVAGMMASGAMIEFAANLPEWGRALDDAVNEWLEYCG